MKNQFTRIARIGSAAALSVLSLSVVACSPAVEDVSTDADVPTDQAAVPDGAEAGDGDDPDIAGLVGETVTISTKVTEVISPNLFTAFDEESMRGEEVLIATDLPTPEVGQNIEVTGDVMEMTDTAVKEAYNVDIDPALVEAYVGKPYIAAKAIEAVD